MKRSLDLHPPPGLTYFETDNLFQKKAITYGLLAIGWFLVPRLVTVNKIACHPFLNAFLTCGHFFTVNKTFFLGEFEPCKASTIFLVSTLRGLLNIHLGRCNV